MRATFVYVGHRPNDARIREMIRRAGDLDARSARVLTAARQGVGVKTGTLLSSIRREFGEDSGGTFCDIVAGVPGLTDYVGYHHFGTQPHIIRPRRRKALRFIPSGGGVVFAAKVSHPGTRAVPFLQTALRSAR